MVKIVIDQENCLGCGACTAVAPELFALDAEGKAKVIKKELTEGEKNKAKEAAQACPVQAIKIN